MLTLGHRGSFLGFTYKNTHSSTLGITRIINSRCTDNLIPVTKDTTSMVNNGTGMRYFGTSYTKRELSVSFAFVGLSKTQFKQLEAFFTPSAKQISDLIFDEEPYKVYSAKITGSAILKYLAFEKEEEYYNGDGNITFTCYLPYARSRYPWQEDYVLANIPEWQSDDNFYYTQIAPAENLQSYNPSQYINYSDWIAASRIPSNREYGTFNSQTNTLPLFNAGDVPMPVQWRFSLPIHTTKNFSIQISGSQLLNLTGVTRLNGVSPAGAGADEYIVVDMGNHTIEGYDHFLKPTGRLYNRFISQGDFFNLPLGASTVILSEEPVEFKFYYLYL